MTTPQKGRQTYNPVDASPVKSFFVTMLTRDISLSDAILDLLDNCVDGIVRTKHASSQKQPYKGFYADITFDEKSFTIHDNCGGIPLSLHNYAFRMGRPENGDQGNRGTVGTYGIGMKRAIFKIGRECKIVSRSGQDEYEVEISPAWLEDEVNWSIPVQKSTGALKEHGTTISIRGLNEGISTRFGHDRESFTADFIDTVSTHYAVIISKGFEVRVNGSTIDAKPIELIFSNGSSGKKGIRPYIYKATYEGVEVFLAVGFTSPISSQEEIDEELIEVRRSAKNSGWTVICNDRVVIYGDKTELTGWGDAGVPSFHSQFIAISGILEFRSNEPRKLPTTTTKRGIDASSRIYLQAKQRMRDGTKQFTDYTNWWKADIAKAKAQIRSAERLDFEEIKKKSVTDKSLNFSVAKKGMGGSFHMPDLPKPDTKKSDQCRISFIRDEDEVSLVGGYLLNDRGAKPNTIGEKCFEEVLREAKK